MRVLLYWVLMAIAVVCLMLAISDLVKITRNRFKNHGHPFPKEAVYCHRFQTLISMSILVAALVLVFLRHY